MMKSHVTSVFVRMIVGLIIAIGLCSPAVLKAQGPLIRLSAEFLNFDFTETDVVVGVPGITAYQKTVLVPTGVNVHNVTMSVTADSHTGNAGWYSCVVDVVDGAFCNPGAIYMAIQGQNATQKARIEEVYIGGPATGSTPMAMVLARDSVVGGTVNVNGGTGPSNAAFDPATAALANPAVVVNQSTTKPNGGSNLHLLNLTFNAFGGIIRWNANPNMRELGIVGNSPNTGEISLSAHILGEAFLGAHIIYETF